VAKESAEVFSNSIIYRKLFFLMVWCSAELSTKPLILSWPTKSNYFRELDNLILWK